MVLYSIKTQPKPFYVAFPMCPFAINSKNLPPNTYISFMNAYPLLIREGVGVGLRIELWYFPGDMHDIPKRSTKIIILEYINDIIINSDILWILSL